MNFNYMLAVPRDTLADNPVSLTMTLKPGTVKQITISSSQTDPGAIRCAFFQGQSQIWPSNPNSFFGPTVFSITWPEDFVLFDPPFELTVRAWNSLSWFSGWLWISITVKERVVLPARTSLVYQPLDFITAEINKLFEASNAP